MKTANPIFKKMSLVAAMSGVLLAPAVHTYADDRQQSSTMENIKADTKEGWKEGMIEGAYLFNDNLNPLDIDVEVKGSTATLTGYVDNEVSKSLAQEVAMSVDGITEVNNELKVDATKAREKEDTSEKMKQNVSDATITVKVKTKLLANSEVSGLKIDVDTDNQKVTLSGKVNTEAESDLAYYIARNTDGVRSVNNRLQVSSGDKTANR